MRRLGGARPEWRGFAVAAALTVMLATSALAADGPDAGVSIESSVEPSTITIGDPMVYTITCASPEGIEVRVPEFGESLDDFFVRDFHKEKVRKEGDRYIYRISYVLTLFQVGTFTIPAAEIAYTAAEGKTGTLTTDPIEIVVEAVAPEDAEDIVEIKPPLEIPVNYRSIIITTAAVLAGLAVLIGILLVMRRWSRGRAATIPAAPPRPADEVALEALAELERSGLLARGEAKAFYTALSEILRRYIEGRYRVGAVEETTAEIGLSLEAAAVDASHRLDIRRVLDECDLVKFAKYRPPETRGADAIKTVRRLVEATRVLSRGVLEQTAAEARIAVKPKEGEE